MSKFKLKNNLPHLTPTNFLKFINLEPINKLAREKKLKVGVSHPVEHLSLWDYLSTIPTKFTMDMKYNSDYGSAILNIAGKLTNLGIISPIPGKSGLFQQYHGNGFDSRIAEYGYYDFLIYSFPYIIEHFRDAIRVIEVVDIESKEVSVGTGFAVLYHPDRQFFVTAKHCLPRNSKINLKIFLGFENYATPSNIYIHPDENVDIAILEFSDKVLLSDKFFQLEAPEILDEIIVAGFPPIPGTSDAILVSSKGEITAIGNTYYHNHSQIYVNANVKGGSSGSPIINSTGYVVGIIIESPRDIKNPELQDELRFGTGMPSSLIEDLVKMVIEKDASIRKLEFTTNIDGSFNML